MNKEIEKLIAIIEAIENRDERLRNIDINQLILHKVLTGDGQALPYEIWKSIGEPYQYYVYNREKGFFVNMPFCEELADYICKIRNKELLCRDD